MRTPTLPAGTTNLQNRDFALLRSLLESRIMTAEHIAAVHFNGSGEAAKKRLQKIKAAGLIGERKRHVNEPSILFLTRKAFKVLHGQGALSEYPSLSPASLERRGQVSELTLRHELQVTDFTDSMRPGNRAVQAASKNCTSVA